MNLTDTFTIDGARRTADGYLAAFARVARTGIQEYRGHELGRPDLARVRVYRPPEEVFHSDALASFAHRPVTQRHPPVPVTSKNWKKYSVGQTGDEVVRDGDFVRVPMVLMDQATIDAYEREGVRELSMGYSTDIKWVTGVTDSGEPYDAIQTAIRGNHLAVVPVARGGDKLRIGDAMKTCPECGAKVDASEDTCPECGYEFDDDNINDGKGAYPMKIMVDGMPVNLADERDGAIIERHIAALSKQIKDAAEEVENFKKKKKDDEKEVADAKALVSARDGEIAVLKKQVADAVVTPEKLDVLVKDRLAVIDAASRLLPKEFSFDGKTLADIKRAAVETHLGDAAKGMDEATIAGAFAYAAKDAKDNGGTQPIRDAFVGRRPGNGGGTSVADAAYVESNKTLSDAWRKPNGAAQ